MTSSQKSLFEFYQYAKDYCLRNGFRDEIEWVEGRKFEHMDSHEFFRQYAFVVLSSGISNKAAESMYKTLIETGRMASVKHEGKRKALEEADHHWMEWFESLKKCETIDKKLAFLETLPWIGPITKYHLARNLGIDVAKPDRHLQKIAKHFGFVTLRNITIGAKKHINAESSDFDIQKMCNILSTATGDRIGTVDVILWRMCNLRPPWKAKEIIPGW